MAIPTAADAHTHRGSPGLARPEFALEYGRAGVIDSQGAGTVAAQRVQPHQVLVGGFAQRIMAQELLGVANRLRIRAFLLQHHDQLLLRIEDRLAQALALR